MTTLPPDNDGAQNDAASTPGGASAADARSAADSAPESAEASAAQDAAAADDAQGSQATASPSSSAFPPDAAPDGHTAPAGDFETPPASGYDAPPAGGYQQPPAGGYQQPSAYPQAPAGGYQTPPPGGYQAPPPGGYQAPPPGGYQAPPPGGYQQQPYQAAPVDPVSNLQLNYWLSVFFVWLPALIFWLIGKDKGDALANVYNRDNLNFSLLRTGVWVVAAILTNIPVIGWLIGGLLWIAGIVLFVFHIMAAVKVAEGYRRGTAPEFVFNVPLIK